MFKTKNILLSTIFLLLPVIQSVSLANNSNNIPEKTYNFSVGNLASGSFTGTDANGNGFLEISEISDFSVFVEASQISDSIRSALTPSSLQELTKEEDSNYKCGTKGLKEFTYQIPEPETTPESFFESKPLMTKEESLNALEEYFEIISEEIRNRNVNTHIYCISKNSKLTIDFSVNQVNRENNDALPVSIKIKNNRNSVGIQKPLSSLVVKEVFKNNDNGAN